jgi:hypothetical protein
MKEVQMYSLDIYIYMYISCRTIVKQMELCDQYMMLMNGWFYIEESMTNQAWKTCEQEDNIFYLGSTLVTWS